MLKPRHEILACGLVLLLALGVLTTAAARRSAEYDEQYTLFLTAGVPRPVWPDTVFPAGLVTRIQAGQSDAVTIARDLRVTDVHPPLYFWSVALWRAMIGPSLFGARCFSVVLGLGTLIAVGAVARLNRIPPSLAMALTLGCYGFAYTASIARGFALAHGLTLIAVALSFLPARTARSVLTGAVLGCAVLANYLAAFIVGAVIVAHPTLPWRRRWLLIVGLLPFVLIAGWFFLAQRDSRTGQFHAFALGPAVLRLAQHAAANAVGGLPLYAGSAAGPWVAAGLGISLLALGLMTYRRRDRLAFPAGRRLLIAGLVASPLGLLGLGVVFNNTPIELRYLSFATPFAALLVAGAIGSLRRPALALALVLPVQAASLVGLVLRPETMQPARATAAAVLSVSKDGVVLLPFGNDGVGIPGAFGDEVPETLPLMIVRAEDTADQIRDRVHGFTRVVLALLVQDDASRAIADRLRSTFTDIDWRVVGFGYNMIAFDRRTTME